MIVRQLFDAETFTYTYLVADEETGRAALIDPVLEQIDRDRTLVRELGLTLAYVLESHVHADHVTAAGVLRDRTGAKTVAGARGAPCVDIAVRHGDGIDLGGLTVRVLETPGHTDDSLSFHVPGIVFTGDTLFIRGTGRSDFQNGDAGALYDSITRVLFVLPDSTVVYPGHDYKGRTMSTIAEEKAHNPRLAGKTRGEFIQIMGSLGLPPPKKLDVAVAANRACGRIEAAV
jgi:glyoxylase-like metal-dependent hydrolase (beta-lactamase superfamily II)